MKKIVLIVLFLISLTLFGMGIVEGTNNTTAILNRCVKQEQQLDNSKNFQKDFERFYIQLDKAVRIADKREDWEFNADENMHYTLKPDSALFGFCPNETAHIWINHAYLLHYISKLDSTWKEYFALFNIVPDHPTLSFGVDTAKELLALEQFKKNHPKFLTEIINARIKAEAIWLIDNFYAFYVEETLSPDQRKAYELYLAKGDTTSEEYYYINRCYEILKENGFKKSDKFYGVLNNYISR